ncbi:MAG: hypothetical protein A3K19_07225 [Lentisphaerae bacterium RIFOXYB12_FULL_65_16]|nr:MAG: hypothetical protein A3K18_07095 [Lentisphaerae bacterium RIFOXYA12_64_32]OGV93313.1 MAG: hypothetical protein A3K19_07225 [Lentisphaerae bacterium RIFOXYB12_FULL_65_16]
MSVQEDATILENGQIRGDYYRTLLQASRIAATVSPGQFIHVQFPALEHRLLRRPFSVCDADPRTGYLTIIYKVVGEGTRHLAALAPGQTLNLLGGLGVGFSLPAVGTLPVVVAGGYGAAATHLLVRRAPVPCRVLIGGRTHADLLLVEEFRNLGANVELATDDGTVGHRGVVTDLLGPALASRGSHPATVYACGPNAMLATVASIAQTHDVNAELSLDHAMCCGVGACLACVIKRKADTPEGWEYVRTCKDGPVFQANTLYWG